LVGVLVGVVVMVGVFVEVAVGVWVGAQPGSTVIVPVICGWTEQKYGKVPVVLKVTVYDWPVERKPLFHRPLGFGELPLVVVWITPSWFVHRTDVPTFTFKFCGTKASASIVTLSRTGGQVGVGVAVCVGVLVFAGVLVMLGVLLAACCVLLAVGVGVRVAVTVEPGVPPVHAERLAMRRPQALSVPTSSAA
jgi:hypothetical protein